MDDSLPKPAQPGGKPRSQSSTPGIMPPAPTDQPAADLTDDIIQSQNDLAQVVTGDQVPPAAAVPPAPPISGPKEQRELGPISPEPEKIAVVEQKEPEPEGEVKDWLKKVEEGENVQAPQPVTDDFGQVLLQAAGQTKPKIVLPIDEATLEKGLHQKVAKSLRWLAEWCLRVMKQAAGRVFYKSNQT